MRSQRAHTQAQLPILLIGRGRMGRALARAAAEAAEAADDAGTAETGLSFTTAGRDDLEAVAGDWEGETILLCVPDDEIESAARSVLAAVSQARFVGHTSGARGLERLAEIATTRGDSDHHSGLSHPNGGPKASAFSLHPLQTVTGERPDLTGAPAAVAGSNPEALAVARSLAGALGLRAFEVPDDARGAYHAAASIASNFLITLEESAVGLLDAAGIDGGRELLAPLVLRSAENWASSGRGALTGPIARGDAHTVARQREAIEAVAPELGGLYDALAERTRELATSPSEVPA